MTIRNHTSLEIGSLILLAAAMGVFFSLNSSNNFFKQTKISLPIQENVPSPTLPPSPTPTSVVSNFVIPPPQTSSQISPDGEMKLSMTVTINKDLSKKYSFIASSVDDANQKVIYTSTSLQDKMSIPFNTWSPDNKYVFVNLLHENGSEAIVIKADGEAITTTETTINVSADFSTRITTDSYDETTGWAADNILIVNTKTSDGTKGPSYWYEIPSKIIILLSTKF